MQKRSLRSIAPPAPLLAAVPALLAAWIVTVGLSSDEGFSTERFWSAAWVWIPGLALVVALGRAGFQSSPGSLVRRALPAVFAVAGGPAMLLVVEQATLPDDGMLSFLLEVAPPAVLAVVPVVLLRASPYWAGCILVASGLTGGVYNATTQGPLDSPAWLITGGTATAIFLFAGALTVVLLAVLAPGAMLIRRNWKGLGQ